jgi:hypothetical protein
VPSCATTLALWHRFESYGVYSGNPKGLRSGTVITIIRIAIVTAVCSFTTELRTNHVDLRDHAPPPQGLLASFTVSEQYC